MITEEVKKIIEENPVAFATVDSEGKPNVIGVAYVKVVSDNQVVITDNYMKHTVENLKANKNVCLATWDKDWEGYKLIGEAEYHDSGEIKKFVEEMKENEGCPAKGAILINISRVIKLG